YHEESVTSNRIWSAEERNGYIKANHQRLLKRWGRYLEGRLEWDLEPEPRPVINWEPESLPAASYTVVLFASKPLKADASSQALLHAAAALENCSSVVIATHEPYSRCRIYSLCREFGIALRSFGVRRIADIAHDSCQLIVTFGCADQLPSPHLTFEQDGAQ